MMKSFTKNIMSVYKYGANFVRTIEDWFYFVIHKYYQFQMIRTLCEYVF